MKKPGQDDDTSLTSIRFILCGVIGHERDLFSEKNTCFVRCLTCDVFFAGCVAKH